MKKEIDNNKNKKRYLIMIIVAVLILVIGLTYAWFKFSQKSNNTNSIITTGKFELRLDEYDGKTIELNDTFPMTDNTGLKTRAYEFDVINKSAAKFRYEVKLVLDQNEISKDNCSNKILDASVIRYQLIRNSSSITINTLGDQKDWIIDTSTLAANKTNKYSLRLWLDENAGNEYMNKHFHAKLEVNLVEDK